MSDNASPPPGVKMPKKRDPRLRNLQQPGQKQFFDSADYEVRRQGDKPPGIIVPEVTPLQPHNPREEMR
ncbi:uncharacterized protein TEOVI_000136100 [Trypanosoma equiperdum]|uniref:Uncharacterized protein n=2 Tax=Trypanozoon TaxID=39700 RepID=Q381R5_TRYB2|nr:hypothetical protein, conserved [Trypanosoma brucei brucei TREU927]EAN80466.1 hypothetical protein, conserved [Trypanosoma brucei brucei TREU927]SCU69792.1 hypothetical protein, conserved [Trypanosoma equiperdum]